MATDSVVSAETAGHEVAYQVQILALFSSVKITFLLEFIESEKLYSIFCSKRLTCKIVLHEEFSIIKFAKYHLLRSCCRLICKARRLSADLSLLGCIEVLMKVN